MFVAMGLLGTLWSMTGSGTADTTLSDFLSGAWSPMVVQEWLTMCVLSAAIIIGSIGTAIAFQVGPPATVAPFSFNYVAFAALCGLLIFSETLSITAILGIGLIILAGISAMRVSPAR
jgi:uncharacterized membrane protein